MISRLDTTRNIGRSAVTASTVIIPPAVSSLRQCGRKSRLLAKFSKELIEMIRSTGSPKCSQPCSR